MLNSDLAVIGVLKYLSSFTGVVFGLPVIMSTNLSCEFTNMEAILNTKVRQVYLLLHTHILS